MKKRFFYFFTIAAFFSFINTGNAQTDSYAVENIPLELIKNATEVMRYDYMKFDIENAKTAKLYTRFAVTILNNKSRAYLQYIRYDKDRKVSNLSARIYDSNGKVIRKIKGKEFIDRSAISDFSIYEDSRVKSIELYHNKYPYTIEVEYTQTYNGLLFYPSSYLQDYAKSVEHFEFIVASPTGLDIQHKALNTDLEPVISQQNNKTVYTWKANNLPALKRESYSPTRADILPVIKTAPTKFQYGKYSGDMSSWTSLGQFIYDLNKDRDQLSPEMIAKVKELTATAENDEEKIAILYKYLQDNMRYVSVQLGIGGYQTFDAQYVEKNKYGDCKALSNFMKAMLSVAEIESYQSLIYSNRSNKIEITDDFTTMNFANHVIINVPSENIWLECTSTDYPPNYIGSGNDDRQTLLLTEEGGKILRTPAYTLDQNKTSTEANIKINNEGAALIKLQTEYVGPSHDYYRYISNNLSKEDLEKDFLEETNLPAFTIDKLEFTNDEKAPRSVLDFHISVPRYTSKAGRRIFIPLNKLNAFEQVPKVVEKRIHPVNIKTAYKEEDSYTITIPLDYNVESIPNKNINLESEFGKYQVDIEVSNSTIKYKRVLEIYAVELPAEKYNELRDFYKAIAKADNMKAVIVKERT